MDIPERIVRPEKTDNFFLINKIDHLSVEKTVSLYLSMSQKEDEAKFEQDFRKKSNEELIYVTSIKKQNRKGKIDHRLLVITESSLRICHARSPYSGKKYFWLDIEKIEEVGLQAVFTFRGPEGGVATVISKKRSKIKKIISKASAHISAIAFESEKPGGRFEAKSRGIFGALKRFRAIFFWRARTGDKSVQFPQDLDTKYRMFLIGDGAELDVDEFAVPDFLFEDFLNSLLLVPTLRKISLTNPSGNHWVPLATFITSHESLREVFTKEAFTDSFREFCSILQSRNKKPIGTLSFGQPSIEAEQLQLIGNVYKSASINSIRFAFTSFQVSFQKVASLVIKPASKLRSIVLDHVQDLRAGEVIPFVQHLDDVSLTYCDLSVSDFLQRARQSRDFRVSCLNLSGNRVTAEIVNVDIPRSVTRLFVDSPNGTTRDVLNLVMKATKSGTKLTVLGFQSILTGTSDEFETAMCAMCKRLGPERSSIETLMWSGNFITPSVLCYFERMDQLRKLSVDGCFERDKMKNIEIFGQFISNNRTITHLSVRGTFQRSLTPDMFEKLMDYLALNRSIQNLTVYHNRLDAQTLKKLSWMLMENRVIRNMFFGDCDIKDPKLLINFYQSLSERGAPVAIPIPGVELEKMYDEGTIDDTQYLRLRTLSAHVENGSNIPIPVETVVIPEKLPEPSYREVALQWEEKQGRSEWYPFDFQEWCIHNSGKEVTAPPPPNDSKFENIMNTEFSVERLMGEVKAQPKCEVLQ